MVDGSVGVDESVWAGGLGINMLQAIEMIDMVLRHVTRALCKYCTVFQQILALCATIHVHIHYLLGQDQYAQLILT